MLEYIVAPGAENDLFEIWQYLFEQSGVETADRVEKELLRAFGRLAEMPGKGHVRSDLTRADVRFYRVYEYMVIYRQSASLEILAVIHGRRDLRQLLKQRL